MTATTLLALDFDGVLCDGLQEYFQTSWRAYRQLYLTAASEPEPAIADAFYRTRPVIETGWEMLVLVRALLAEVPEAHLHADWPAVRNRFVTEDRLDGPELARLLDGVRDEWIACDLDGWLGLHRFYPGAIARLQAWSSPTEPVEVYIVTTKEGRFTRQLLQRAGVELPAERIIGKEIRQPKAETLRQLQASHPEAAPRFVEDRLATLENVARADDLDAVELFLAEWGYTTETDRDRARASDRIYPLTLSRFTDSSFANWTQPLA